MSGERRSDARIRSFARILVSVRGRVGYIADVGEAGFKGLFPEPFGLEPGSVIPLEVSFEEIGLAAFTLRVLVRWTRVEGGALVAGFSLAGGEAADAELFDRIKAYYSDRSGDIP